MTPVNGSDYPQLPQLLKHNGAFFSAMVYIRKWHKPFNKPFFQVQMVGTNDEAVAAIGEKKKTIPAMTIEAWSEDAYDEVLEATGDEENGMYFVVRMPKLSAPTTGRQYLVRILEANFVREYDRRNEDTELFSADLENIRVFGTEAY